jgi:DnaJ-class molecular chaperone
MTKTLMQGPRFEGKTCTRCTGTGMVKSADCPICHGARSVLTKRGRAAKAYMQTLLVKPATEVKEGDVVWFPVGALKVASSVLRVELGVGPVRRVRLHGRRRKNNEDIAFSIAANGTVALAHTPDELEQIRIKVEEYQGTLTKEGEVALRRRSLGPLVSQAA